MSEKLKKSEKNYNESQEKSSEPVAMEFSGETGLISKEELIKMEDEDRKYVKKETKKAKQELSDIFKKEEAKAGEEFSELMSKEEILDLLEVEEEKPDRGKIVKGLNYLRDELENNKYTHERGLARLERIKKFLSEVEKLAKNHNVNGPLIVERMLGIGNLLGSEGIEEDSEERELESKPELKKEKELENSEKMSQEELEKMKKGVDYLADYIKRIGIEFSNRDNKGLSPLIDIKNIDKLKSSVLNLESADNYKNNGGENLRLQISKIVGIIDKIGDVDRRKVTVKEDLDSLKKVSFLLGQVQDSCTDILSTIRNVKKEEAQDITKVVLRLKDGLSNKQNYVTRLISAFNRYYGK